MSNSTQKIHIFKSSYLPTIGILLLVLLAAWMMWFNNANSTQAIPATVANVRFYGEYVDDNGRMQMDLKIYTYDTYDMVDIANLKVGDTVVRHYGEVKVVSKEQSETGTISINGGLENGGFDLVTDDCGIFYETGFNDVKNWYEIGEATIRVSVDFKGIDNSSKWHV